MGQQKIFKLGTRGSLLALRQATLVQEKIQAYFPDIKIDLEVIKTSGDRIKDRSLIKIGGKGLFTKEIDEKILTGEIDLAVHSMKDVETFRPQDLDIVCYLERQDPRDVLISERHICFEDLPKGAKVGTCSPRRTAQILSLRSDLQIVPLRGNVDTRLRKLDSGECDALILAYAGLQRLQLTSSITQIFDPQVMTPAVTQGVIGVEIRQDRKMLKDILLSINHLKTACCVEIERQFLKGFEGNCRTAIAGWAQEEKGIFTFQGLVLTPKGERSLKKQLQGTFKDLVTKAFILGQEFRAWYQTQPQTLIP